MYKWLLVGVWAMSISCGNRHQNLAGYYTSRPYTIDHKAWDYLISKKRQVTGSSLKLDSAGIFEYETCGNISKGDWIQNDDSLFLFENYTALRIDTTKVKDSVSNGLAGPIVFKIEHGSKLYRPLKFVIRGKVIQGYEILIRKKK